MALLVNSAEAAASSGSDVTVANSAVTDAWSAEPTVTGGTVRYSDTSYKGSLSIAVENTSNANVYFKWAPTSSAQGVVRFYFQLAASSSFAARILSFAPVSESYTYCSLVLNSNRTIGIQNSSGTTIGTTTGAISIGTWYRVEMSLVSNTTVGAVVLKVYADDDLTEIANLSLSYTDQATGGGAIGSVRFGRTSGSGATATTFYFDDIAYEDGTTTLLGPSTTASLTPAPVTYGRRIVIG